MAWPAAEGCAQGTLTLTLDPIYKKQGWLCADSYQLRGRAALAGVAGFEQHS